MVGKVHAAAMLLRLNAQRKWKQAVEERQRAEMWTGQGNTRRVDEYKREADAAAAYIRVLENQVHA